MASVCSYFKQSICNECQQMALSPGHAADPCPSLGQGPAKLGAVYFFSSILGKFTYHMAQFWQRNYHKCII